MLRILNKRRASLTFEPSRVVKRFHRREDAERELGFYLKLPFGHPELIDFDDDTLVMERLTPVRESGGQPARALARLIGDLHRRGISHRDIHLDNIVVRGGEPLLIDWETAIDRPGYDLFGPDSGVPVPDIHAELGYEMWVAAPHRASILCEWRVDLRTYLGGLI